MTEFNDLVDTSGLDPDEEARLRRVHELLVDAGPPPELPYALSRPPAERGMAQILRFPARQAYRLAVAACVATAAVFAGGYLLGHSNAKPAPFAARHTVTMSPATAGTPGLAILKVARPDSAGNWPMEISVTGLPQQTERGAYYELWLTDHGKPGALCGTFRMEGKTTTLRLNAPYDFERYDGWVVTAHRPGEPEPGRVLLTT
jgi:hypothetical protein